MRFAVVNTLSRIAIVFMRETCFILGWAKVRGNRNTRISCRYFGMNIFVHVSPDLLDF